MLGSAVCQHEPRCCSRSDGRQVPLTYLCGLKVSHPAGIHSLNALLFSHYASLQYILSSSVCVLCQWAGAAPVAGGVVFQYECRGEMVPSLVFPAQSWLGSDKVWTQVRLSACWWAEMALSLRITDCQIPPSDLKPVLNYIKYVCVYICIYQKWQIEWN